MYLLLYLFFKKIIQFIVLDKSVETIIFISIELLLVSGYEG